MFTVCINVFFVVVLPIIICICVCCCNRYHNKRTHRSVVTRVMPPNPSSRGTTSTAVTLNQTHTPSNQVTSSFNISAAVSYPQEPVYKDAQLSCQDAPPSYFEATAYPAIDAQQAAQVIQYEIMQQKFNDGSCSANSQ